MKTTMLTVALAWIAAAGAAYAVPQIETGAELVSACEPYSKLHEREVTNAVHPHHCHRFLVAFFSGFAAGEAAERNARVTMMQARKPALVFTCLISSLTAIWLRALSPRQSGTPACSRSLQRFWHSGRLSTTFPVRTNVTNPRRIETCRAVFSRPTAFERNPKNALPASTDCRIGSRDSSSGKAS